MTAGSLKTKDYWERVKLALMMQSNTSHARGGKMNFTTCAYPNPKALIKATP
jgi:hypothetical protein